MKSTITMVNRSFISFSQSISSLSIWVKKWLLTKCLYKRSKPSFCFLFLIFFWDGQHQICIMVPKKIEDQSTIYRRSTSIQEHNIQKNQYSRRKRKRKEQERKEKGEGRIQHALHSYPIMIIKSSHTYILTLLLISKETFKLKLKPHKSTIHS